MKKGINMNTNESLEPKQINSISFGESVFSAGFIQKTVKADLHVRFNCPYPQRNGHQKTLEDSGGLHTEAKGKTSSPHL